MGVNAIQSWDRPSAAWRARREYARLDEALTAFRAALQVFEAFGAAHFSAEAKQGISEVEAMLNGPGRKTP